MPDVNLFAVVAAAVSSFLLGGLWYSKLMFETTWVREANVNPQDGHPPAVFAVSFLFSLIAALAFAAWLGPEPALKHAVTQGLLVGAGFVATCFGINYQFAQNSLKMWLIDAGYHTCQFALFGLVLGLWH